MWVPDSQQKLWNGRWWENRSVPALSLGGPASGLELDLAARKRFPSMSLVLHLHGNQLHSGFVGRGV